MNKIGFIGAGNMGKAIIGGLLANKQTDVADIFVSDFLQEPLKKYAESTGVTACGDNLSLANQADCIVLAVKPQVIDSVLAEIQSAVVGKLVISIAAGVSIERLQKGLGADCHIIRTMPNTPAMVGEGLTVLCYGNGVTEEEKTVAKSIFQSVGKVQELEEKYLNSVIALTSSSPAYFFMMIEAMADGAVKAGLPRKISYEMAAQAMLGSAKMVLESGKHPGELKDMVCSPAGTTIEAVKALEETGFRGCILEAMDACTERANNL